VFGSASRQGALPHSRREVSLRSQDPSTLAQTTFRRRVGRRPCPLSRSKVGGYVRPRAQYPRLKDLGSAPERAASLMNSAPSFVPNSLIWTPANGNDVPQFGGSVAASEVTTPHFPDRLQKYRTQRTFAREEHQKTDQTVGRRSADTS
jgi:hypothetical protein